MTKTTQYKNTPIGQIPKDWEVKEFSEFVELSKVKYTTKSDENLKCLELEHFNQETGSINGWVDSSGQKSTKNKFIKGQVLFGKLRPYLKKYWLAEFDGVCSSEVWVLNSKSKICNNEFLFRLIQSNEFIQVSNVSSGSKMPRADWNYVSTFPFPIPPLPEQQKIAEVLSIWDKAIQKTDAIIKKLEERNKGLAFSLLTGKKRVKGFEGEWKKHKLDYFFEEYKKKPNENSELPVFTSSKNGLMNQSDYYSGGRISSREDVDYNILPNGFITYRSRSDDGLFTFNKNNTEMDGLISGYYPVFKVVNGNDDFFLCYLNLFKRKLTKYSTGTSQLVLSFKALKLVSFLLPSMEEQNAIAEILNTANQELKHYQNKLEALKQQKKGLMQQLLTGKVRTI